MPVLALLILAGVAYYALTRYSASPAVAGAVRSFSGAADSLAVSFITATGDVTNGQVQPTDLQLSVLGYIGANNTDGFFDPAMVMAICEIESGWNPSAVTQETNGQVSTGLMQIEASTATQMGFGGADLTDPATNIACGMAYLRWSNEYLTNALGGAPSTAQWVASYNAGVGNVVKGYADLVYVSRWTTAYDKWAGYLASAVS